MKTVAFVLFTLYKVKCFLLMPVCWFLDHDPRYVAEGQRSVQVECRRCGYLDIWSKAEWARHQKRKVKCKA